MAFKTEVLNFSIGDFSGDYEKIVWQRVSYKNFLIIWIYFYCTTRFIFDV